MRTEFVSVFRVSSAVSAVFLLAACQGSPPIRPPSSELQLLDSTSLRIPSSCSATGSYIVSFTVATSGRPDAIRALDAPACVEQALTAWVASFRYAPPSRAIPTTIEWMMVTAKRGS